MPNSAKAAAREMVKKWLYECHEGSCELSIEDVEKLTQRITDILTTFAAEQVQATWEKAAKLLEPPSGTTYWIIGEDLLRNLRQEFCRLAQEEHP